MRDWWRLQEFILPRRLIECLEQIGADCGCVPMVKQTGEEQWKQVGPIKVPHEIVLLGVDRGRNTFRKRFPHEVEGAPVLFVMPRVNDDEFRRAWRCTSAEADRMPGLIALLGQVCPDARDNGHRRLWRGSPSAAVRHARREVRLD